MPELPDHPTPLQVELHFRNLLDEEGLEQPDEVWHEADPDEVVFVWHDPKVAIVIQLGPEGPLDVRPRAIDGPPV